MTRYNGKPCKECGGTLRLRSNWKCVKCNVTRQAEKAKQLWREALVAYGPHCTCCGEKEVLFLTLDHVEPLGDQKSRPNTFAILRRAKREGWPKAYRILCWNCNCGRARNGGECPHNQYHWWKERK